MSFFCFKQKTAYEMRISDWSSDVCSSDLLRMEVMRCGSFAAVPLTLVKARFKALAGSRPYWIPPGSNHPLGVMGVIEGALEVAEIGRASCRERVCQYV